MRETIVARVRPFHTPLFEGQIPFRVGAAEGSDKLSPQQPSRSRIFLLSAFLPNLLLGRQKLHNVMQSMLLRPDQIFWDYGTFERALEETHFFFRNLTPDQMKKWLEKKGHYPPRGTFITRQMHKLFWDLPEDLQQKFTKKLPQDLVDSVLRNIKATKAQM